jgi:hypothetical protein
MVDNDGDDVEDGMESDGRIALLERRTERLSARVERLEAVLEGTAPRPARGNAAPPERPRPARGDVAPPSGATWLPPVPPARPVSQPPAAAPPPPATPDTPSPAPRARLEDLVAGRVLAWAGGAAVFIGLVLLLAVAVSRGWIGEGMRVLMAGAGSLALAATGAWLQERRARTDAAMAAAAAGVAGLFATSVVAARVYEVLPVEAALGLALATGAAATALALRWRSRGMAVLGVLGGLAAPLLAGAPGGGATAVLLLVAAAAAVAICVHQGWDWLGLAAFAVVTPQWIAGLLDRPATAAGTLGVLAAFGALFAAAAAGHDLRARTRTARPAALLLLALNAFVASALGWALMAHDVSEGAADAWLAIVAAAHVLGGLALLRTPRASRTLALATLAIGAVVADVALARALDGVALALVWTGAVVGFAAIARGVRRGGLDDVAAGAGLGVHLALALLHVLVVEAPPEAIAAGEGPAVAATTVAALAAACFASGAVLDRRPEWRDLLHALGLAALAYLAAVAFDGAALVVAWAAEAAALTVVARRAQRRAATAAAGATDAADGPRGIRERLGAEWVAGAAVPVQLALAAAGAVVLVAPARAIVDGATDLGATVAALLAVAAAAAFAAEAARGGAIGDGDRSWRVVLHAAAVAALVWLAAVTLDGAPLVAVLAAGAALLAELARRGHDVTPAATGAAALLVLALGHAVAVEAPPQALLDGAADLPAAALALVACALAAWRLALAAPPPWRAPAATVVAVVALHLASVALVTAAGAGERAQMLLSALWAGAGVAALIAGLVRDLPALRTGALTLVFVALAKVFLYDLATLTALARVASFLALGLLLLGGAFAWQRIRPQPLPDLREAPPGARG